MCGAAILVARFLVFVLSEDVGVDVVFILLVGGYWMESKCNYASLCGIDDGVLKNFLCSFYVFVLFIVHCFVCFVLGLFDFKVLFLGSRNSSWGSRLVS